MSMEGLKKDVDMTVIKRISDGMRVQRLGMWFLMKGWFSKIDMDRVYEGYKHDNMIEIICGVMEKNE